ncbi:MAG: translation initiation factor IF-2 [Polyangiaceae bacterium]|nr:translation initiation factor IF-2 [Polyangiaceae bacterium]
MSKVRVYEVARELGIDNKAVMTLLRDLGVPEVRNHMSAVPADVVDRVRRHLDKQNGEKVEEQRIHATVVKRRRRADVSSPTASAAPLTPPRSSPTASAAPVEPEPPPVVVVEARPAAPPPALEAPAPVAPAVEPPAPEPPRPPVVEEAPPAPSVQSQVKEAPSPAPEPEPARAEPALPPPPEAPVSEPPVAAAPAAPVVSQSEQASEPPPAAASAASRPSTAPKTGIDVWKGRPGVPMPQAPRGPTPRRVQYDAKAGAGPGGGPRGRGPMGPGSMRPGPGGRPGNRRFPLAPKRGGGAILTQERSAHKKVVRIEDTITLQQLGQRMGLKANQLLTKLMQLGMSGVHINSTLDADTAKIVANEFGWEVENVAVSEEEALKAARGFEEEEAASVEDMDSIPRPPVVAVMGHVDHGKTSLLDRIRKADVAAGEAGGITQHIGAYSVKTKHGKITFLDTPGHAAFSAMRARGAKCTDLVILVVAADDGVMPQTKEAINHARAAGVPIVVAVNKIDKEQAQPERVRRELSEQRLVPEEWGGDTLFTEVSAATGQGIDNLLEQVILQAEVLELRANPKNPADGVVVEAQLDRGMGALATVLVTDGTLHRGDYILAGRAFGKIRAMHDHTGRKVNEAGPSTPVSVIGLDDVPFAGDSVHAVKDLKKAQEIAAQRKSKNRSSTIAPRPHKMSLEELARQMSQSQALELKVIIKADVQGSVEALRSSLEQLSTEKVKVTVVHAAAGSITESDVNLAVAADAMIIGFNVRPAGKAAQLAQQEGIEIRRYEIIYAVVDDVKASMEGLLAPTLVERALGKAEVLQVFRVSKAGTIAGCMITDGLVRRNAGARVLRDGVVIHEGKITSLKRFKDDVREVKNGFECGLSVDGFSGLEVGDQVEAFEFEQVKQTL